MVMKFTIITMSQTEKNSRTFPEYLIYFVKKYLCPEHFKDRKKSRTIQGFERFQEQLGYLHNV